ncbi:hypothetical protein [Helicobacter apodemus]|nr:hypothetical protein [Helicobacter apodemus]
MEKRAIKRNKAIIASYKREINLQTRFVRDRSKYTRKVKHKARMD